MMERRKLLINIMLGAGSLGLIIAVSPFLLSMFPHPYKSDPSHKIVDVNKIPEGGFLKVEFDEKLIIIFKPSENIFKQLESLDSEVWGPPFSVISNNPVYVYYGVSTSREPKYACAVKHIPKKEAHKWYGNWPGGWIDPCHKGAWDYAGRAFRSFHNYKENKISNLMTPLYRTEEDGY